MDPAEVAVDRKGDVFVADSGNKAVKEIVAAVNRCHRIRSNGQRSRHKRIAANAGTTTSTLSIQTSSSLAMNKPENSGAPLAWAVLLLPVAFFKRVRKNGRRYLLLFVVLVGGIAAATGLSGCFVQAIPATSKTDNLTITATSGTLQHSVNITLIVDRPEGVSF